MGILADIFDIEPDTEQDIKDNGDDIKGPIAFLASENTGYITGNEISISGGWQL